MLHLQAQCRGLDEDERLLPSTMILAWGWENAPNFQVVGPTFDLHASNILVKRAGSDSSPTRQTTNPHVVFLLRASIEAMVFMESKWTTKSTKWTFWMAWWVKEIIMKLLLQFSSVPSRRRRQPFLKLLSIISYTRWHNLLKTWQDFSKLFHFSNQTLWLLHSVNWPGQWHTELPAQHLDSWDVPYNIIFCYIYKHIDT